jgi:hypothetical protein
VVAVSFDLRNYILTLDETEYKNIQLMTLLRKVIHSILNIF